MSILTKTQRIDICHQLLSDRKSQYEEVQANPWEIILNDKEKDDPELLIFPAFGSFTNLEAIHIAEACGLNGMFLYDEAKKKVYLVIY